MACIWTARASCTTSVPGTSALQDRARRATPLLPAQIRQARSPRRVQREAARVPAVALQPGEIHRTRHGTAGRPAT
eukprot:13251367-Alexandrium_andersonii.AAC.1